MAIDLFSVVLSSAVSWGVNRLLDSALKCFRCGENQAAEPDNDAFNDFRCGSCRHSLHEYINATQHTVNRNKSVVAAKVHGTHWPAWREDFKIFYSLDVVNSPYQEIVVELLLSKFRGDQFDRFESIRKPTNEYSYWTDTWISIPRACFPEEECTVAVDLNVYNIWRELLDRNRDLMSYSGRE
jgi:hypothetical protein